MAQVRNIGITVLNNAVAGDAALTAGNIIVTGLQPIPKAEVTSSSKVSFTAGVVAIKEEDFTGINVLDNTQYRLVTKLLDQKLTSRTYVVNSGPGATAASIRDLFITAINGDSDRIVDASDGGVNDLDLTHVDVNVGADFVIEGPAGIVENVATPYTAPAGTVLIVEAVAPGQTIPTGQYTTWQIVFKRDIDKPISGDVVQQRVFSSVFGEENAVGFAAFAANLDAALA